MSVEKIFVLGAGTMGNGIAQTAAVSGYRVTLMDVVPEALERAKAGIAKSVDKLASKGAISEAQKEAALNIPTVSSLAKAEQMGVQPLARIVGYDQAAVEAKYLFAAPAKAIPRLLDKVGWSLSDVDLIELNEAFAAQTLANGYELAERGWDWAKVNVNGGAIALGHPIGASGARVLGTLIHALRDRGLKRGIASLCLGGSEAVAMAVEVF